MRYDLAVYIFVNHLTPNDDDELENEHCNVYYWGRWREGVPCCSDCETMFIYDENYG